MHPLPVPKPMAAVPICTPAVPMHPQPVPMHPLSPIPTACPCAPTTCPHAPSACPLAPTPCPHAPPICPHADPSHPLAHITVPAHNPRCHRPHAGATIPRPFVPSPPTHVPPSPCPSRRPRTRPRCLAPAVDLGGGSHPCSLLQQTRLPATSCLRVATGPAPSRAAPCLARPGPEVPPLAAGTPRAPRGSQSCGVMASCSGERR